MNPELEEKIKECYGYTNEGISEKLQQISDKLDKWDKILNGELMVMSKEEYRRRGNQSEKYQTLKSGLEEIYTNARVGIVSRMEIQELLENKEMIEIDKSKYHWEHCKICDCNYAEDNSKGHTERCVRC